MPWYTGDPQKGEPYFRELPTFRASRAEAQIVRKTRSPGDVEVEVVVEVLVVVVDVVVVVCLGLEGLGV